METMQIKSTTVTIEDIVFQNRNKAYGAYFLNRHNTKYLFIAFLTALIFIFSSVVVPFIKALRNPETKVLPRYKTSFTPLPVPVEIIAPPLAPSIPPPAASQTLVASSVYAAPVVGKEIPDARTLEPVSSVLPGIKNPPVPETGPLISTPGTDAFPDERDTIVFCPQEFASFRDGDINAFRKWVQQSIVYPERAVEYDISGKLFIQFCVNTKGDVVDVRLLNDADPVLFNEAYRVLMSSPRWKPARQGGYAVKQQFRIPVVFKTNS